ncbi:Potassium channel subfamily K member 9 [Toxocara canis]|uniref:Potassium channel subfamily K member 9 n=1 Tax=Toxocara canis TaxID=6265 RepID=A0A0B2VRD7_TOXCA|nr:Potassium channel subfamily K member 9 [Toxocara canis]
MEDHRRERGMDARHLAQLITEQCIVHVPGPRQQWNFLNAALYAFGILTTLGYGKIEPLTTNGRIFAVIYGFIGIPVTVIIFTNFGRYIQYLEEHVLLRICGKKLNEHRGYNSLPASALFITVAGYLVAGASLLPFLNGKFDFFNGIYWAFLCFTAIEYGELVPENLKVQELINAVAQNIGIEPSMMRDIDLESLVSVAIKVKEGKLSRVPQTHMVCDGIWPPELVPLFIKEGAFPEFVDDDKASARSSSRRRRSLSLPHSRKPSVRFQELEQQPPPQTDYVHKEGAYCEHSDQKDTQSRVANATYGHNKAKAG